MTIYRQTGNRYIPFVYIRSYLFVLKSEMLQVRCSVAFDRVQAVVEHSNDFRKLRLPPWCGGGAFTKSTVQWRHAASLSLSQRSSSSPIIHITSSTHVTIQSALIWPTQNKKFKLTDFLPPSVECKIYFVESLCRSRVKGCVKRDERDFSTIFSNFQTLLAAFFSHNR